MRLNDIGLLAIVLLAGLLIGVIGTLGVYNSVVSRQSEAERAETEQAIKDLEYERDQLQARINDYDEAERNKRPAIEQPGAEEAPARPAKPQRPAVATGPRPESGSANKREGVPAPREDRTSAKEKPAPDPAGGFGPPREYGDKK